MNQDEIAKLNKVGMRAAYGRILLSLAIENSELFAIAMDTSTSAGLDRFRTTLPNQYLDASISEQAAIGVASGLTSQGKTVFVSSFAPFVTMRVLEQIKVNVVYSKQPVVIVGIASGIQLAHLGYTHCAIEDMAVVSALPDIEIHSPVNCFDLYDLLKELSSRPRATYIRLTGDNNLIDVRDFQNVGWRQWGLNGNRELVTNPKERKSDMCVITIGSLAELIPKLEIELQSTSVECDYYIFSRIRPLDFESVKSQLQKYRKIFIFEEHVFQGGLAQLISLLCPDKKITSKNIKHSYEVAGGNYNEMLVYQGLSVDSLTQLIREFFEE